MIRHPFVRKASSAASQCHVTRLVHTGHLIERGHSFPVQIRGVPKLLSPHLACHRFQFLFAQPGNMTYSPDKAWLEKCHPEHLPVPPFDRYVYMLEGHVVKKSLRPGESGFDGYQPDISTIAQRDENEIRTLETVRQYTNIPVPKLIYQGDGQV